jgi:hypothetical protein
MTSGATASGGTTPGSTAPGDTTPADTVPGGTAPADTVPGDTVPGGTGPGRTAGGHTRAAGGPGFDADLLARSRALLIGVSAYEYAEFPPIRAARNSLQAMRSVLTDPALGGWPPERISVAANPGSAAELASGIADLADATTGVLLLYYVGHGVLSARGELCLTVTSTRPDRPKITGLPWDTLADVLRGSPASTRLAILDCCFAGQAIEAQTSQARASEALSGDGDPGLADITHVEGVYTLTATTRNRTAHVPPAGQQDSACTSFTGELHDLIRTGIPGKPPRLTFGDIYPVLRQRLRSKGLPAPGERGTAAAGQFTLTANAAASAGQPAGSQPTGSQPTGSQPAGSQLTGSAHPAEPEAVLRPGQPDKPEPPGDQAQPGGQAEPSGQPGPGGQPKPESGNQAQPSGPPPGPSRHASIVADALRAAHSVSDESAQAQVLAAIARAVARTDPDRAARLAVDAARVAQSITREPLKGPAMAAVAGPLATVDADRAEREAEAITSESARARAQAAIARAVARTDPDRAARLIADAERLAESITDQSQKASALAGVAEGLAATDPDHAEPVARSVGEPTLTALALVSIARAVGSIDPDWAARLIADAERLTQFISGASFRAPVLAAIARELAGINSDRAARLIGDAERLAQSIPDPNGKGSSLAAVAEGLAATDPERAERLAQSITAAAFRALGLAAVAEAWAGPRQGGQDERTGQA